MNQPKVVSEISKQIEQNNNICGVMLESFLEEGNQSLTSKDTLKYGQSITDACMAWETTLPVLHQLAESVDKKSNSSII